MFNSLLKVALSPIDVTISLAKDAVNTVTCNDEKGFGEETGDAIDRLGSNLRNAFEPDKK